MFSFNSFDIAAGLNFVFTSTFHIYRKFFVRLIPYIMNVGSLLTWLIVLSLCALCLFGGSFCPVSTESGFKGTVS